MKEFKNVEQKDAVTICIYHYSGITVGHATLRTYPRIDESKGIFVDFRPKDHESDKPVSGFIKKRVPVGEPDVRVNLYGLNINAIEKTWEALQKQGINWNLIAKFKTDIGNVSHNSISLCLVLLWYGGLFESHSVKISSSISWLFQLCESSLKTALKLTGTSITIGELMSATSIEDKVKAALKIFPIVKEAGDDILSQTGMFARGLTAMPGELEDILRKCKIFQDETLKIQKHEDNLLVDLIPEPSSYCLIS